MGHSVQPRTVAKASSRFTALCNPEQQAWTRAEEQRPSMKKRYRFWGLELILENLNCLNQVINTNKARKKRQLKTWKRKKGTVISDNHSPLLGCEMNNIYSHGKVRMICFMGFQLPESTCGAIWVDLRLQNKEWTPSVWTVENWKYRFEQRNTREAERRVMAMKVGC